MATGAKAPYTWRLLSGSLPTGLTLSKAGVISGTPVVAQTSGFTVAASDSSSPPQTDAATLAITVTALVPLKITSATLPAPKLGVPYSATMEVTGGIAPYSWTGSDLPAGLSISKAGVVSGTPTTAQTVTAILTVTDSS